MSERQAPRDLRTRLLGSGPAKAGRQAAVVGLRPLTRRLLGATDSPRALLSAARLAVPGGSHQVPEEITAFIEHARARRPRHVCEIGTAGGGTTILLSRLAPTVETMIGVDLEIQNERAIRAVAPSGQRLELLAASSLDPATVERIRGILGGEPLDVLFIDGSHLYADVRQDVLRYRPLVRPGGLIAFHDIVPDHGTRLGRQTHNWAGGVPDFWREVSDRFTSREFIRDPEQDAFGIGVLEHDPAVGL